MFYLVRKSHMLTLPSSDPVTKKHAEESDRTAQHVTGARCAFEISHLSVPVAAS